MVNFWPLRSKDPRHSSITFFNVESETESVSRFLTDACETFEADYGFAHPLTRTELDEHIEQIREHTENGPFLRVQVSDRLKKRLQASGYAGFSQDEISANIERVTKVPRGGPELAKREGDRMARRISREGFASVLSSMISPSNNTVRLRKCLQNLYWVNYFGRPYLSMFRRECLLDAPAAQVREFSTGVTLRITEQLEDEPSSFNQFKAARDRCKEVLSSNAFLRPGAEPGYEYRAPKFDFASDVTE